MDKLTEKLILIDAIDCKIEQLTALKNQLINEHNDEVRARQAFIAEQQKKAQEAANEVPVEDKPVEDKKENK